MSDTNARPHHYLGDRIARLLDRLLTDSGKADESGYYVDDAEWPPSTSTSTLHGPSLRRKLDQAFDRYYDTAITSLATVKVPGSERPDSR